MTENRPIDNDDDDIAYTWTQAQASISQAFKKGLIEVRMREEDGTSIYQPLYLAFTSSGEITIVVDRESVTFI